MGGRRGVRKGDEIREKMRVRRPGNTTKDEGRNASSEREITWDESGSGRQTARREPEGKARPPQRKRSVKIANKL